MKKFFGYIIMIALIIFSIPILFTKKFDMEKNNKTEEKREEETTYNYGKYDTIKLLHIDTNEVENIPLDEYLYGVVSSEMPANFEEEALKAQAVVARTYTIFNIKNNSKHENADICDSSKCCQAWISKEKRFERWNEQDREQNWNKITEAVNSTKGKIITYENEPINAFFHSNSGGTTETADAVWGGKNYPYLQTVVTSGEDAYTQYSSEVILSKEELVSKIKEYHSDISINFEEEDAIKILDYTNSGRVKNIKFGNLTLSGTEIRTIMGLKSSNFTVEIDEDTVKFEVIGYGHGVGMSQTGADSMAKQGESYEEIIKHFYSNVEISNL